MADFHYVAKTTAGATVTGVLSAETEATALRLLDERNLVPLELRGRSSPARQRGARRRVRTRDLGIMYGQLADLIGAGVPLLRALDSLIKSTVNPRLAALLREVRTAVADGTSLTEALRAFPETFPPLHTAMVQAGERASFLEDVLRSLATFLERLDELRSKVIGSLIYPALLATVGTLVLVGALLFFVPRFEPCWATPGSRCPPNWSSCSAACSAATGTSCWWPGSASAPWPGAHSEASRDAAGTRTGGCGFPLSAPRCGCWRSPGSVASLAPCCRTACPCCRPSPSAAAPPVPDF
ncbi:MAG: type II secretion system F family protein [Verrucomicrobia bacterium]|nr:type II secretion system F family protein [Verrucomicrobiota bacterium]